MKINLFKTVLAGLILSVSSFANAGIITFGNGDIDHLDLAGTQTESGFEYTATGSGWEITSFRGIPPSALVTFFDDEGASVGAAVDIVLSGGGLFELNSIDFRGQGSTNSDSVTIFGFQGLSEMFSIDLIAVDNLFHTHLGTVLSTGVFSSVDLLRIQVSKDGSSTMILDNVNLNVVSTPGPRPVPEPSTLAIFALGIMGLASRQFKK